MEIKKTNSKANKTVKAIIYGPSGIGKTTLAGTLKDATLIISAESGLLSLQDKKIDYVNISTYKELQEIYVMLKKGSSYKNIFIDSLTEISSIIIEDLQKQFPERKDALVMYGENAKIMKSFIKSFRDLEGYNVFITALEKHDTDDMKRKIIIPDIIGSMAMKLPAFFDEVLYCKKIVKDDKEVRCLISDSFQGAIAKDRSGKLNQFEEMNLQKIVEKILC